MSSAPDGARFDVALALRRVVLTFWHDFAPIVVLGFVMVTLPQVAQTLAGSHSGSTILASFGGMLGVLYVVIVTVGTLARLAGKPLGPLAYARAGLAASPRGLSTALLLAAGIVVVLVVLLLASAAPPGLRAGALLFVVAAAAAAVIVVPAVPAAIVEQRPPLTALVRAGVLTRGARGGIAALLVVVALALIPARVVVAASIYGFGASLAATAAVDASMTLLSPGLWLLGLFDLLAWGIAATVPAVVYVEVTRLN